MGQGYLTVEASRLYSDTPYSVGLLCKSDQPETVPLSDNTEHSQETASTTPAGFLPTIPASDWPQTHALDRAVPGIGI